MKNLFKKETEADKIKKEIENIVLKKNSIISAIETEKQALLDQKNGLIFSMGQHALDSFTNGTSYEFENIVNEIRGIDQGVEEKNIKISELVVRYDEEVHLMHIRLEQIEPAQQPMQQQPVQQQPMQQQPVSGAKTCGNCNVSVSGNDAFCENCGNKL